MNKYIVLTSLTHIKFDGSDQEHKITGNKQGIIGLIPIFETEEKAQEFANKFKEELLVMPVNIEGNEHE